jgi:hypothetical protein
MIPMQIQKCCIMYKCCYQHNNLFNIDVWQECFNNLKICAIARYEHIQKSVVSTDPQDIAVNNIHQLNLQKHSASKQG